MIIRLLLGSLAALIVSSPAFSADRYPTRPVRMIVPYPPGGGSDLAARAIGQKLNESLGQTFVIDNRPDATGPIPLVMNAVLAAMPFIQSARLKALAAPDVKARFASLTLDSEPAPPETFRNLLESEDARWKGVLKEVRIRLD